MRQKIEKNMDISNPICQGHDRGFGAWKSKGAHWLRASLTRRGLKRIRRRESEEEDLLVSRSFLVYDSYKLLKFSDQVSKLN